jgi:hypothetical protein
MCSDVVVIAGERLQNLAQMHLAQDNDVVHTLTPDRPDQPFGKAIMPGRGWCGRLVLDAHGAQSARDDAAIDPVAIADEVVRLDDFEAFAGSAPPTLRRRASMRSTTLSPAGRSFFVIGWPARFF